MGHTLKERAALANCFILNMAGDEYEAVSVVRLHREEGNCIEGMRTEKKLSQVVDNL